MLRLSLALCIMTIACAPREKPASPPAATQPREAPDSQVAVASEDTSIPEEPDTQVALAEEDTAEPEPTLPVAPDGTQALPCATAPLEGMACIPGGPFTRGSDSDEHTCEQRPWRKRREASNTRPASEIWQQTFYMDVYEVTYAEFKACIKSRKCDKRPEDDKWGPTYRDFDRDKQPITNVNWFQARQYCQWKGKHLPTEAEWEKAARGPEGELNPWGNEPANCENAVIKDPEKGRSCGVTKIGSKPESGRVLEVGSRPAGRYGLYDMVGNVEEWVADWYTHSWEDCGDACLGVNPKGPCDGADDCDGRSYRVVRGGSWYWDAGHGTGIHRRPHIPENPVPKNYHHFGFRCAASPEEATALMEK